MPIVTSSRPVRKPAKAKGAKRATAKSKAVLKPKTKPKTVTKPKTPPKRKTSPKTTAPKKTPAKKAAASKRAKPAAAKPARQPRAKVLNAHPDDIRVDTHDYAGREALERANAKAARVPRAPRKRTATDNAADAACSPPDQPAAASLVARVSDAIERELSKIERIVGNPTRIAPAQRVETESRARVLASLARTLKEVMRLREQERGDDSTKAADDDAVPRDLDEFRRELSRRLEGLVADAAPPSAGEHEPG